MSKTMDDLMSQVETMNMGLTSDEDLNTLFNSLSEVDVAYPGQTPPTVVTPSPSPAPEPTPAPAPAPAPQPAPMPEPAPQPQPQPALAPTQGEPSILDKVPDKFKGANVQETLLKAVKSYEELEAARAAEKEELARLQKIVSQLGTPSAPDKPIPLTPKSPAAVTSQANVDEIIPDSDYFDKPNEAVGKKTVQEINKNVPEMIVQKIREYHDWNMRQLVLRDFKKTHPDFDNYVQDVIGIAQARPDIDRLPADESLPILYDLAKEKAKIRIDEMRKNLGIVDTPPAPQPSPPPPTPQPVIDPVEMERRILTNIVAEIQKRKRAAGITGAEGTPPVNPVDRATPAPQVPTKTYSDEVFDRMLATKPKHPDEMLGTERK